jgi:hypothetical protein
LASSERVHINILAKIGHNEGGAALTQAADLNNNGRISETEVFSFANAVHHQGDTPTVAVKPVGCGVYIFLEPAKKVQPWLIDVIRSLNPAGNQSFFFEQLQIIKVNVERKYFLKGSILYVQFLFFSIQILIQS